MLRGHRTAHTPAKASYLQVFDLLLLQQPLQVGHVVVLEQLDVAPRRLQAFLDGEAGGLVSAGRTDHTWGVKGPTARSERQRLLLQLTGTPSTACAPRKTRVHADTADCVPRPAPLTHQHALLPQDAHTGASALRASTHLTTDGTPLTHCDFLFLSNMSPLRASRVTATLPMTVLRSRAGPLTLPLCPGELWAVNMKLP